MTSPISDDAMEAIRAGLEGVTPGPWFARDLDTEIVVGPANNAQPLIAEMVEQGDADEPGYWGSEYDNARHIARLDPATVRSLLARIEAAEAALKVVVDERKKQSEFVAWLEDLAENPPAPTDALRKLFADYTDAISTGALITDLPRKEPSP
jgi:hypothetical protein